MTNNEIVEKTSFILANNKEEWEPIYERYANSVVKNKTKYGEHSRCFKINSPLHKYSSLGKVMSDSNTSTFDLRFAGQSIGTVYVNTDNTPKVKLTVTGKQSQYAKEHFGFENSVELDKAPWDSEKAQCFRSFFQNQVSTKNIAIKSEEHRIENFLLQEFSKKTRKQAKKLCNIRPVRLGGQFFQLTTPLTASKHNPKYSVNLRGGATGGGIDILARVKQKSTRFRLAIIELKDENKKNESQELVLQQALIYATFIAHLLRSKSGNDWWKIFRENFDECSVPNHLDLNVVSLMPQGDSHEGDMSDINLKGLNATLHLYTLYYTKDKNGNPKEFFGSLKDALLLEGK